MSKGIAIPHGPIHHPWNAMEPLGCFDCGRQYNSPGWVETHIHPAIWNRIAPKPDGGGVLCPCCMSMRLYEAGFQQQTVPCQFVGTSALKSIPAHLGSLFNLYRELNDLTMKALRIDAANVFVPIDMLHTLLDLVMESASEPVAVLPPHCPGHPDGYGCVDGQIFFDGELQDCPTCNKAES